MGYFYINSAAVTPSNFNFYISGTTWDGTSIPEYSADVKSGSACIQTDRRTEEKSVYRKQLYSNNIQGYSYIGSV
jgi:hypothetical protein